MPRESSESDQELFEHIGLCNARSHARWDELWDVGRDGTGQVEHIVSGSPSTVDSHLSCGRLSESEAEQWLRADQGKMNWVGAFPDALLFNGSLRIDGSH